MINEYAKRRIFECPSELGQPSDKPQANVIIKLDHHYDQCALNQLKLLEADFCEILHITNLNLYLVTAGCLQLTFQLPWFIKREIFPLSHEQKEKMVALHVIRVTCGYYCFLDEVPATKSPSQRQRNEIVHTATSERTLAQGSGKHARSPPSTCVEPITELNISEQEMDDSDKYNESITVPSPPKSQQGQLHTKLDKGESHRLRPSLDTRAESDRFDVAYKWFTTSGSLKSTIQQVKDQPGGD